MTYTKQTALHDRVTVDGTDASNLFSGVDLEQTDADVDLSGFSVSGNEESASGARTQTLSGTIFITPEGHALLYPLFKNRTVFPIEYQPDGLVAPTREVWSGNVQIRAYPVSAQRAAARTGQISFKAADDTGIVCSAGNT